MRGTEHSKDTKITYSHLKMNNKEFKKIEENFKDSLKSYDEKHKSNHWQFQINRKI